MATEITMPKLSDTMTDGRFIGWRKSVGERIERGEIIAEVETDKAVMELEAFASGVLLKIMATGGETVPVGTALGLIGEPGEAFSEVPATQAAAPTQETPVPTAVPPQSPEQPLHHAPTAAPPGAGHEKASPLVRQMARDAGIDLALVHGSGPEGRILQEDLAAFRATAVTVASPAAPPGSAAGPSPVSPPQPSQLSTAEVTPGSMRQAISATVTRSWREIPHFTVTMEIDMHACREIIGELKGNENAVGYNALVVKGCATALRRFPRLNAVSNESGIHIGFAVALDDGLLVPVIRDCGRLLPRDIERETARLAERARNGRLTQAEMSGSGFTVSNLGMYGVDEFMALIMPGQTGILAIGAVEERPAVRGGQLVIAPTMRVTLSSDHRIVDGAYAAAFLAELRRILEQPMPMFL